MKFRKNIIKSILALTIFAFILSAENLYRPIPEKIKDVGNCEISLNGMWKFKPDRVEDSGTNIKNQTSSWENIKVPGEWAMQGYAVDENVFATYFNKFFIPENWENKQIFIRFDGVYSKAIIKVNGEKVGKHTGGFTAFEFDITEYVRANNKNEILVYVKNESLADTLVSGTQYAAHQLGGITRKVTLFAVPKFHICDLFYTTTFDNQYKNAVLSLQFEFSNYSSKIINGKLNVLLYGPDKKLVKMEKFKIGDLQSNSKLKRNYQIEVKNPAKWDSEHPRLYTLKCELLGGVDNEVIKQKVGFREIEIAGNKLFINGDPIKLKGVNRHEVHPLLGRSLTDKFWLKDAELFRGANMNFIRTAHYPSARDFVSICDSIGLFVELEAPFAWIGHHANKKWQDSDPHAPQYYDLIKQQINETVQFYKNNPSVIIWSMANESAWGPNWEKAFKFVDELDPSRPKTFHDQAYGGFNNYGSDTMQIANIHYPGPGGPEVAENFKRPLLFGEFCHINTYNRQEVETDPGVRDYWGIELKNIWEDMYSSRGCLGGAIWSGINDVFYLSSNDAVGYGQWGVIDGWRRKKPEYWHCKKVFSPVKIHTVNLDIPQKGNEIKLQVENQYNFTSLEELKFSWKYNNEEGEVNGPHVLPGEFGILKIDHGIQTPQPGLLSVSAYDQKSRLVDSYSIKVGNSKKESTKEKNDGEIKYKKMQDQIVITSGSYEWIFDSKRGKIKSAESNNQEILTSGAELMMLPLKTGPCDTEHRLNIEPLNETCSNWKIDELAVTSNDDTVEVNVTGNYDEGKIQLNYYFLPNGFLEIAYDIKVAKKIDPRQIGLVFSALEEFHNLSWERDGLWTSYPEDHIGRNRGIAKPFYYQLDNNSGIEKKNHIWSHDYNELGSNDFRSTKNNIYMAKFENENNEGIKIISEGKHSVRAFVDGDKISFLVADFSIGGGELFLGSHLESMKKKLEKGDVFKGTAKIKLLK